MTCVGVNDRAAFRFSRRFAHLVSTLPSSSTFRLLLHSDLIHRVFFDRHSVYSSILFLLRLPTLPAHNSMVCCSRPVAIISGVSYVSSKCAVQLESQSYDPDGELYNKEEARRSIYLQQNCWDRTSARRISEVEPVEFALDSGPDGPQVATLQPEDLQQNMSKRKISESHTTLADLGWLCEGL